MKSLRRSLNNEKNSGSPQPSPPLPISYSGNSHALGRPAEKVAPPQKVIKALTSHQSTNPQELSYSKGDFWYVTGERDVWFEALNPLTGSRGLVPKIDFEEFVKGGRHPGGERSVDHGRPNTPSHSSVSQKDVRKAGPIFSPPASADEARTQKNPVYAIVQYDFRAERPDELEAKKGEPIVIMAQSNHEWFVAKPIGRLGGPGLIPVAFVEVRDPKTGQLIEIEPNSIPMVEEWKKKTAEYKAAAIPLGKLDIAPGQGVTNSPYAPAQTTRTSDSYSSMSRTGSVSTTLINPPSGASSSSTTPAPTERSSKQPPYVPVKNEMLPLGDLMSMSVPSFHQENGVYWFRLQVTFVPDDLTASAYTFGLYRSYEDFYDFQIALLDTFPVEAGRSGSADGRSTPERILPYMPGPVDYEIDDELTEYRREELDVYVKELLDLKSKGAGFILRHELFRAFFATRHGDHFEKVSRQDALGELEEQLADVRLEDYGAPTNGMRSQSVTSRHSQSPNQYRHSPQAYQKHTVSKSMSSRGASPLPPINTNPHHSSRPDSSAYSTSGRQSAAAHYVSGGPSTANTSSSWGMGAGGPPSTSTSATTPGTAPQSGPPPYIKIKIYDRATDDLIAIRVHLAVTFAELSDKVRARLGPGVTMLRYRVSMDSGEGYRELMDDKDLKNWLRAEGQKLVLYAEQ
ncbi:bud emergence protein 1 [Cryptococcus neoformans]|nr:bud emergence protein 1 [Cryptococcus neoformans var. grubii AD1-7a]OXH36206.1 bud emergence protein 1 [Cryptococcus neoformans var. grubii]